MRRLNSDICESGIGAALVGAFCATVGAVDEETVRKYIENQRWEADQEE